VKLGVLLPTFRDNTHDALATADAAESAGLDGVFAFDHLWPIGSPTRPSFAPMPVLAAVAARTASLKVGTLVARMALVGTSTLVERFLTLEALAPGRVIAGLGTGDELSKDEQVAYDVGYPTAEERWALLADAMEALRGKVEIWCGAGLPETEAVTREHGATLNLWAATPERVREVAQRGPVNWAGPIKDDVASTLDHLRDAGATWAVIASSTPTMIGELEKWRRAA
jgi:alkanesulfonate monooxygenase SsuD/methylene tetrahydromethanopterin reductase-like flavin-dependent oxidoreductase (luciferase family)